MRKITLGNPLVQLETVDSTNNYAMQLLRKGPVAEGTVILAVLQTHGRGQGESKWISEKGLNLLFSLILKTDFLPAQKQFYLSMSVAVGIHEYISGLGLPAKIKWPNDLLIGGNKVAGILIENTILSKNLNTSIIGIGLNVNQRKFPAEVADATSLVLHTGINHDLTQTLNDLLICLEPPINNLYTRSFTEIKSAYLNRLWKLNSSAEFSDRAGTYPGRIVDIAETGELMVMNANGGLKTYGFKEVTFR